MRNVLGSDNVQARQFVQNVFGQVNSLNLPTDIDTYQTQSSGTSENPLLNWDIPQLLQSNPNSPEDYSSLKEDSSQPESPPEDNSTDIGKTSSIVTYGNENSDKEFWRSFSNIVNQNVVQKFGIPTLENIKWDKFDLLDKIGLHSQTIAETSYVKSGLATAKGQNIVDATTDPLTTLSSPIKSSLLDIKKVTQDLLRHTDSILGGLMVLNTTVSQIYDEARVGEKSDTKEDDSTKADDISESSDSKVLSAPLDIPELDEEKAAEMRELFSTAESAMEAWAMLATALGHPSFIKSEFEKLCFLDNEPTDTQVTDYYLLLLNTSTIALICSFI